MVQSTLYYAIPERVHEIPVVDGNIIFVPQDDTVYLDMANRRYDYSLIHICETELDRSQISPRTGFYFVEETNALWRWNRGWSRVASGGIETSPIMYADTEEDFPVIGEQDKLYYTDEGIYNWKSQLSKYNLIANANKWESM